MEKCIHCLTAEATTYDHTFPNSWYPDDTEKTVQRPTVPSCFSCNNSLSLIEEKLRVIMALCIDPKKAKASGIQEKVLRGLGVRAKLGADLDLKELEKRRNSAKKILASLETYAPEKNPYPGFGPHEGYSLEDQKMIQVPDDLVKPFFHKVIRGLEYEYAKRYIEHPYEIGLYEVKLIDMPFIESLFKRRDPDHYGPGFKVERLRLEFDPKTVFYRVKIWDTWTMYATVAEPRLFDSNIQGQ